MIGLSAPPGNSLVPVIARITEIRAELMNIAVHLNSTCQFGSIHATTAADSVDALIDSLKFNAANPYGRTK